MAPIIIPIFLPHSGCLRHCLFCNQKAIIGGASSSLSIRNFIETSLIDLSPRYQNREKQVAFYGGSFTAMKAEDQLCYLKEVQPFIVSGRIHSIRLSTRPDALDEETLAMLKKYGVKTIEIGAQSMVDEVLSLSQRGHRAEDTASATSRLKSWGVEVGIHLMMGLPGDTIEYFLQTIDQIIELEPDFVRIHPTLVLKGAFLEDLWRAKRYTPLSLEETIQWLKKGMLKLEKASIPVSRIGLQPTEDLEKNFLAGPYHPALHHLVDAEIFFDMAVHLLNSYPQKVQASFLCHPKELSNLKGQKNENIFKLRERYGLRDILIQTSEDVPKRSIIIQTLTAGNIPINRLDIG